MIFAVYVWVTKMRFFRKNKTLEKDVDSCGKFFALYSA